MKIYGLVEKIKALIGAWQAAGPELASGESSIYFDVDGDARLRIGTAGTDVDTAIPSATHKTSFTTSGDTALNLPLSGTLETTSGAAAAASAAVNAHTGDTTDAHAASAVGVIPVAPIGLDSTTVQAALEEIQTDVNSKVAGMGTVTDNRLPKTSGTDGKVLEQTGISVDDSNNVTGVVDLTATNVTANSAIKLKETGGGSDLTSLQAASSTSGAITVTLPAAAGTLATLAGTETLTNKYFNGGTASADNKFKLPEDTYANLVSLAGKTEGQMFYANDVDKVYYYTGTALVEVGSGSGQGRKNYILNPNAATDTSNWTASGLTVTKDTSTSIPRETTTGTAFKLVATTSGQTLTSAARLLDDVDLNKVLGIILSINCETASAFKIDVIASATEGGSYSRISLTTDVSAESVLPLTKGDYKSTFTSPGSATPWIKFVITSKAAGTLYISDITVTPEGSIIQGAVVEEWKDCTMTTTNVTSTIVSKYLRVGSNATFNVTLTATGNATGDVLLNLPVGMTIDNSRNSGSNNVNGCASVFDASASLFYIAAASQYGTTNSIGFMCHGEARVSANDPGPDGFDNGDTLRCTFSVPIAEWAGSGTVNLAQNDVEYLSNSTSFGTNNNTAFQYGAAGQAIAGLADPGATTSQRVRALTSIQSTDQLLIELSTDRIVWTPAASSRINGVPLIPSVDSSGSNISGIWLERVSGSTTDVDVFFGRFMSVANDDSPTVNWPTSNAYWRVRKTSAGAAVGFGIVQPGVSSGLVSAQGLPGRTDGQPVAAGYVGDVIASSDNGAVALSTSYTTVRSIPITITGEYSLKFTAMVSAGGTVANGGFRTLVTTSSSGTSGGFGAIYGKDVIDNTFVSGSNGYAGSSTCCFTTVLSAGTTIYMRVNTTTGTPSGYGYIEATRIA